MLPSTSLLVTLTSPPMLGVDSYQFSTPWDPPTPLLIPEEVQLTHIRGQRVVSGSLFVGDGLINPHPRFSTLTQNIRLRRGSKVAINLPIFKDSDTPFPFEESPPKSISSHPSLIASPKSSLPDLTRSALPNHVYMDAMAFGMGCSCLQITFQACSIEEARRMYDQLAVVSPIMVSFHDREDFSDFFFFSFEATFSNLNPLTFCLSFSYSWLCQLPPQSFGAT